MSDENKTSNISYRKECKTIVNRNLGDAFEDYSNINSFCRNQEQLLAKKWYNNWIGCLLDVN